jgi:hypothetical protein
MASRDPYLARANRALKDLGCAVQIEVVPSGKRFRLRATLPHSDGDWRQQRISTPFPYPMGIEQARKLAEQLGKDIELHRMGLDPFPTERWFGDASKVAGAPAGGINGIAALRLTEIWWSKQRKRGVSADVSWATDYVAPLKSLLDQEVVDRRVLKALVESTEAGSQAGSSCAFTARPASEI